MEESRNSLPQSLDQCCDEQNKPWSDFSDLWLPDLCRNLWPHSAYFLHQALTQTSDSLCSNPNTTRGGGPWVFDDPCWTGWSLSFGVTLHWISTMLPSAPHFLARWLGKSPNFSGTWVSFLPVRTRRLYLLRLCIGKMMEYNGWSLFGYFTSMRLRVEVIKSSNNVILEEETHQPIDSLPHCPTPALGSTCSVGYSLALFVVLPAWQPFCSLPLGRKEEKRVISIHLWVTRSSGY